MKQDNRTGLQKINDRQNFDYLSIFVAVQVIAASIFYLLFFTWNWAKKNGLRINQTVSFSSLKTEY